MICAREIEKIFKKSLFFSLFYVSALFKPGVYGSFYIIMLLVRVHIYILCCLFLFSSCLCSVAGRSGVSLPPKVVAHRGGAALAPENTLLAIGAAMAAGVDMVEIDVRMTADGYVVLLHDEKVNRTTDGKGRVGDMTLAQVKELSVVSDGRVTSLCVPTLEEVLLFVAGRCGVLVEVKDCDAGVEYAVADVIRRCDADGWVAVQSFSDAVLERFCALGVSFPLEKLFVFKIPFVPYIFDGSVRRFSMEKYCYISSFNIHRSFVSSALVETLHASGKTVKAWTFPGGASGFCMPVDAVITDSPQLW